MNPIPQILLLAWASLAAATPSAQQQGPALHGLVTAERGTPLPGARLTFQPEEDHQVALLQGWVGAAPRQVTVTDGRGAYKIASTSAGCLLVQHERTGLGAIAHRVSPGSFRTVQARPMGELVLPGDADAAVAHVLAVSPAGQTTHLGQWPGPRVRLPEGRYRLLVGSGENWTEFRCQVVSGQRQELSPGRVHRVLRLYDGFRGRVTLHGWPRVALGISAGKVRVPDGPGPRILQVWEERAGCVLLHELWVQERIQTLVPSSGTLSQLDVQDADGKPVVGAWCFSCYQGAGGVRIVSRSRSDGLGRGLVADVSKEPTGFVLALREGFAVGHVAVFGAEGRVEVQLRRGYPLRVLVMGPRGDPQPEVEVRLEPLEAPWAERTSFTDPKGEVLFKNLPLGPSRVRLLGTPFLVESHVVRVTELAKPAIVRARMGHELRGRVLLPAGEPAANALVVVRDPRGSLPDGERIARTGTDGSFSLPGLPKDLPLVLTASLEHDGRTWTSRALRVEAASLDLRVQLLAEDWAQPGKAQAGGKSRDGRDARKR